MQRQATDEQSSEGNSNRPQFTVMLGDNLYSVETSSPSLIEMMFYWNIISALEKSDEYTDEQKLFILAGAAIYCKTVADARSASEVKETVADSEPYYWPTRPSIHRDVCSDTLRVDILQPIPATVIDLGFPQESEDHKTVTLAAHAPIVPGYIRNLGLFHRAIMPPQDETAEAEVRRSPSPRPGSPMEEVD